MSITYDGMVAPSRVSRAVPVRGGHVRRVAATRPARLTRRGRVVVVLFALLTLLVVAFFAGRVGSQAAGPDHRPPAPTVTVMPGESLWAVAARVAPHADPRLVVDQIQRINHLSGPQVVAGQQLVVPAAR